MPIQVVADNVVFAEARMVSSPAECYYYHTMELPEFGLIEGQWDLRGRFDDYIGHLPLGGKRVLDVGCASGFLSFEMENRNATVVSMDANNAARDQAPSLPQQLVYRQSRGVAEVEQRVSGQPEEFLLAGSSASALEEP